MTKEIILDYLHQHKEEFNKRFGVTKIALFGSYARNEATPTSDIDIAIEVTQPSLKNRFALQSIFRKCF
jgi:predicted nucleotidyltransferase